MPGTQPGRRDRDRARAEAEAVRVVGEPAERRAPRRSCGTARPCPSGRRSRSAPRRGAPRAPPTGAARRSRPPRRLRPSPIAPVAQNVHARAQPDCDETQTARRSPCRISTVSSGKPSALRKRAFTVPSLERCSSSSVSSANGSSCASRVRSGFESVVTSSHEPASSRVTPCRTWVAPIRWLAPLGEQRDGGVELHESKGTHDSRPGRRRLPRRRSYPPSDPLLAEMERQGEADGVPIVLRDGGLVLGVLARALGARRVVECGTAIGVSTLHLARAVGEGGMVVTFDVDPDRQATARALPGAGRRGRPRRLAPPAGARRPARPRGPVRPGVHRRHQVGVRRATWSSCCRCSASAG